MAEDSYSERTEEATPRRREEARKRGQGVKSREIPSAMILLGGISTLFLIGPFLYQQVSLLLVQCLRQVGTLSLEQSNLQGLNAEMIRSVLVPLVPFLGIILVVAVAGHVVQGGPSFSPESLKFDWSKANPLKGLSQFLSKQALIELLKSLFKILIIGGVAWSTIKGEWSRAPHLYGQGLDEAFQYVRSVTWSLFLKTGLILMLLAGLDYLFQRWSFEKGLRMTKQEVKEEAKMTEGDPLIKSRIRQIQRQMARRRMMAEVPKADVIITNPTHLAVALLYRSKEMVAPQVVAKGAGEIAERIKEIGRRHQVPIVENKSLAQVLYKTVDLGQTIPSTLYQMVADILAYVYRLKNRTLSNE
jgi:flagellar biosynthetic protein FlhB